MPREIAFVDDDSTLTEYYLDALRGVGYEPSHFKSPDSCFTAINAGHRYELFVVDLMMPSYGKYTESQTCNGLKTGAVFTNELRFSDRETPIIMITHLNVEPVFAEVKEDLADLANVFVVRKATYTPAALAESVGALLEDGLAPERRSGILRRFWDSLLLEPNLFGMGVKLKELIRSF